MENALEEAREAGIELVWILVILLRYIPNVYPRRGLTEETTAQEVAVNLLCSDEEGSAPERKHQALDLDVLDGLGWVSITD
jgi:hypothetical protein